MDNPCGQRWSPPLALVIAGWAGALFALLSTVLADDPPSRLFGAVATLFVGAAALFGSVARPRFSVDQDGVALRGLLGVRRWPWSRVHRLRVVRHRRLGRDLPMLELDAVEDDGSERLVVLGWLDLGAHPDEVLAAVRSARGL